MGWAPDMNLFAYQPQPGTIQHQALAWLRSMAKVNPGQWVSTVELCEAIGAPTQEFSAYMAPCRANGLVKAERRGLHLYWTAGDGTPIGYAELRVGREPRAIKASKPLKAWKVPEFRALEWGGKVLVTGMEVRDGVAIFTREQIRALSAA